MLRILFVTHSFPPVDAPLASVGGMQRVATELHEALGQHPRVELSTRALRSSWRWIGPNTARFLAGTLATLPRQARASQADVVLFSSMVTAALAPLLRERIPDATFAVITHGQDVVLPIAPYQWWTARVFEAMDVVLPVSRATGQECIARGAHPGAVRVQPNGIHTDRFPTPRPDDSQWLRSATGAPGDSFFLISVGRQVKRKGSAWFIEHVLPRLPGHAHYVIVGTGPEDDAVQSAAERMGLTDRVHALGRVSEEDLPRALRGADLFVMPNIPVNGDMEGFGVVMLEAGLCELPVIAAEIEGIADVVENGSNGHLLPPLNAEAFAEEIARYMNDRPALTALSRRAAHFTIERFAWPAVAEQLVSTLEQVRSS